jgi:HK97 family phage prohead protease
MEKKNKETLLTLKAVGDDGTIEGYGSTFGGLPDSYGDVVQKGAFAKTLHDRGAKVKMLWQHRSDSPIGVWDSMQEDSHGLKMTGRLLLSVQQGREAYELLKAGAIEGLSIGYIPVQQDFDAKTGINTIKEVKLLETSVVTFPANTSATITAVKSAFEELDEEMRIKTLEFINNLKQSPLESNDQPPTAEASTGNTEVTNKPVEQKDIKPQSTDEEDLHLLEQLLESLKQRNKGVR